MKRISTLIASAALGVVLLSGGAANQAQAAGCYYKLHQDGVGILHKGFSLQGYGHAAKVKTACKRAEKKCNRRLKRARKKHQLPRGNARDFRCVRTSAG